MSDLFDTKPELVRGKRVLELGSGAAVPSMVCSINGAAHVVCSDWPDVELLDATTANLKDNVSFLQPAAVMLTRGWCTGAGRLRKR